MKRRLFIAGLFVLTLISLGVIWCFYSSDALPQIANAEQLRKDCMLLCEQFPLSELQTNEYTSSTEKVFPRKLGQIHYREISKENWPSSIQQLHPFRVTRDEYAVCIWLQKNSQLSAKDIMVAAKGYYIHTNPSEVPPRSATHGAGMYFLYETKYDGIEEFDLPAAVL